MSACMMSTMKSKTRRRLDIRKGKGDTNDFLFLTVSLPQRGNMMLREILVLT